MTAWATAKPPLPTLRNYERRRRRVSPGRAQSAGAGIDAGVAAELAVELADERDAVAELELGAYGSERGVAGRGGTEHGEGRDRQGLEEGRGRERAVELVRPGRARAQGQRPAVDRAEEIIEARAKLAARLVHRLRAVVQPEACKPGGVDLAIAGPPEPLRLQRSVRSDAR